MHDRGLNLQRHFSMNEQLKAIVEVSLQMASGLWFSAGVGGFALTDTTPHPRTSSVHKLQPLHRQHKWSRC